MSTGETIYGGSGGGDGVESEPPVGDYKKVKNVYVKLVGGQPKFIFQWDDGSP